MAGCLAVNCRMEKSDQLREWFRRQQALNERIGVKTEGMSEVKRTIPRCLAERMVR